MEERVIQFHDRELTFTEAEQLKREITADPVLADDLDAVRRIDRAAREADLLTEPRANRVRLGEARLLAEWSRTTARRRRIGFAVGATGIAAAAVTFMLWPRQQRAIIGNVKYTLDDTVNDTDYTESVHAKTSVQAGRGANASVHLFNTARLLVSELGHLRIGAQPDTMELVHGRMTAEVETRITIHFGASPFRVVLDPGAKITLHFDDHGVYLEQETGTGMLQGVAMQERLEAPQTLHIPVDKLGGAQ